MTDQPEMIERVARALRLACVPNKKKLYPWGELEEYQRDAWRSQARAAIAAMREPTREMIERATDGEVARHVSPNHAAIVWQLAIDAAMEGK